MLTIEKLGTRKRQFFNILKINNINAENLTIENECTSYVSFPSTIFVAFFRTRYHTSSFRYGTKSTVQLKNKVFATGVQINQIKLSARDFFALLWFQCFVPNSSFVFRALPKRALPTLENHNTIPSELLIVRANYRIPAFNIFQFSTLT
jgi:hypothetical protein